MKPTLNIPNETNTKQTKRTLNKPVDPTQNKPNERCASAAGEGFGGPGPETFTRSRRRKRSGAFGPYTSSEAGP